MDEMFSVILEGLFINCCNCKRERERERKCLIYFDLRFFFLLLLFYICYNSYSWCDGLSAH